jgi:hypothetical protein
MKIVKICIYVTHVAVERNRMDNFNFGFPYFIWVQIKLRKHIYLQKHHTVREQSTGRVQGMKKQPFTIPKNC